MILLQVEVLPEIVKAVGSRVEVYADGGIRHGTDVFKALVLGAKMVSWVLIIMFKIFKKMIFMEFLNNSSHFKHFLTAHILICKQ